MSVCCREDAGGQGRRGEEGSVQASVDEKGDNPRNKHHHPQRGRRSSPATSHSTYSRLHPPFFHHPSFFLDSDLSLESSLSVFDFFIVLLVVTLPAFLM